MIEGENMLKEYIESKLKEKDILLMTHIVIGYPDFEKSYQLVQSMVEAGVDLMELQIPFTEPIADGPVILKSNQAALDAGATVPKCLEFAKKVSADFSIPFLYMSYANILFKYGEADFAQRMQKDNIAGAIVPDLPPEEGKDYLAAMKKYGRDPIFIYTPTSPAERMRLIASHAGGFIYCVARRGITGQNTAFSSELEAYLKQCRQISGLPIALGFGVKDKSDIDFLKGKAEIAVVGTQSIRVFDEKGCAGVKEFLKGLR